MPVVELTVGKIYVGTHPDRFREILKIENKEIYCRDFGGLSDKMCTWRKKCVMFNWVVREATAEEMQQCQI